MHQSKPCLDCVMLFGIFSRLPSLMRQRAYTTTPQEAAFNMTGKPISLATRMHFWSVGLDRLEPGTVGKPAALLLLIAETLSH